MSNPIRLESIPITPIRVSKRADFPQALPTYVAEGLPDGDLVLGETVTVGPDEALQELLAIEAKLAARMGAPQDTIRSHLIELDYLGLLVEDGLVAEWHQAYAVYVNG